MRSREFNDIIISSTTLTVRLFSQCHNTHNTHNRITRVTRRRGGRVYSRLIRCVLANAHDFNELNSVTSMILTDRDVYILLLYNHRYSYRRSARISMAIDPT